MPAATNHASRVSFTQFGTGTVRMCLPLPTRSTMAQRSSRRCKQSNVSSASSRRRSPQPSKIANIARLRFPVRVWPSGDCQKANASLAVNQFTQTRAELTNAFDSMDAGSEFGAHQTRVCCLISKPTHSGHSHVDRPGRETAFFQDRYRKTTVLLNASRGSEQYQETNSSIACW